MRADNGSHSYERTYNICTENNVSIYVDTLEEVRAIAAEQPVKFVGKGYAESKFHHMGWGEGEIEEIIRRTTGSVHRRHWHPDYYNPPEEGLT